MKKFLQRIGLFSLLLVLMGIAGYVFLSSRHVFPPSHMYYNEEFNRAFQKGDIELLALGNSKLLSSLDKDVLQNELHLTTSILGYSSANISISRLTLEAYLHRCIAKPRAVLLEVSWFAFNNERTAFHVLAGDLAFEDYTLLRHIVRYRPHLYYTMGQAATKQLFSMVRHSGTGDFSSHFEKKSPTRKDYQLDISEFEKVFPTHYAGVNTLLLEDFYSIVDMCTANGIPLFLYSAPEDKDYALLQNDRMAIKEIFRTTAQAHNTVFFLDYTLGGKLYDEKFELWLRDSHHINENDLFTHQLVRDMRTQLPSYFPQVANIGQ